jgi:DnaK suppressor protein
MTKEEREQLKNIIQSELEKLSKKVLELKELTGSVTPDDAIGRISRMDAINNNSIVEASIRNLENRLDQLAMAARVIDEDDFGRCIKCHQPIPFERMKLRPEIRLCANCMNR